MRNEFSDLVVNNMCKSPSMEKNKGKVDDVESFKRRNCIVQESEDDPGESEASGDRMSRYSSTSSINDELPELVVFLQETNYEFVKDICIDKAGTSCEECFEENCDTQNGYVPCMLKSDVAESDIKTTEESEDLESSILSTDSTQVVEKNLLNKVNENQKFCYDAKDDIPSDFSNKKSVPKLHLDRKVTGKRVAASSNSIAISLTKILDENKLKGKGVAGSNNEHGNVFHDSGLSPSGVGGGGRTSTAEDYAPENQTGRYRSIYGFVYQRDDGSSEVDPAFNTVRRPSFSSYVGSDSLGSNDSTNSSHSFAFPILQTEWNGSPERMATADPRQTRRLQLWRLCLPCCNF
ncbi:uncharacterized protein LOC111793924 [Cucurbita pepo subsp. pepo]|uniref:uncharacterized protein LOC111793924 n=1 Tax=Cucurbita pepo subsp. pepo TaxID=3664 RepID=UPI000C9D9A1B|nr:uncharacterized protein LOC111793924 [Cucurbita pepo subsp. pepo]